MEYFATLFVVVTMVLMVSIVGRRICDLASFRFAPVYRLYFSPVLGLALFVLIFTIHGWVARFSTASSIVIVGGLVLASLYFEKNRKVLLRYLVAMALFSLLASSSVLFPLLRFDAYNPFNDTFTYLVHGQWLQAHSFSDPALASGQHPVSTQVSLYQKVGLRMGASFMLGWAQSLFGLEWSYYAYPALISLPLLAGALAAGGAVQLIARRGRLIPLLTAALGAAMLNGVTYGAMSGFLPQTFGLAFAVASATLLAAVVIDALHTNGLKAAAFNCVPAALVVAALIVTYNDMLSFVGVGVILSLALLFSRSDRKRRVLVVLLVLFVEIALLVNLELLRVIRNFVVQLLNVGSGMAILGWPVLWSPVEFLALAFGLRSPLEGFWIFGTKAITLAAAIVLAASVLYFVAASIRGKRLSAYLATHLAILLAMVAGFFYFRYFGRDPSPAEAGIGYTFLQFKLANWAGPFCVVLMGATFAHFHGKARSRYLFLVPAALVVIIALGVAANYRIAAPQTAGFLREVGYPRSGFSALLHLRELAQRVPADDIIFLNLGQEHLKLRQMIAYVLYDRKLAADWTNDNYVGAHLPAGQQKTSAATAAWIIDFADPAAAKSLSNPSAGNLVLRRMPPQFATLASVNGGHTRENDDSGWWNWVAQSVTYTYRILGKPMRLKFTFMSIADGSRALKVTVKGKDVEAFNVKAQDGWNEFLSPPLEVGDDQDLSVTIVSEGRPVKISATDARMASFMVKNLEILQEDTAVTPR